MISELQPIAPSLPTIRRTERPLRIVHLPFYDDNPYQTLLMQAQRSLGHEVFEGGGGGNFAGVAWRKWRADILHFHWLHPYLLRQSATASLLRSSRFLTEVALLKQQGAHIAWTIHNLVNHDGLHSEMEKKFSSLFSRLADACYVHSRAAAAAASQRFSINPRKIHVIPHGHYIGAYPNEISRRVARAQIGIPENAVTYLFLGRIEPYKGVFDLIDAFEKLPSECHLLIVGKVADPNLLSALRTRIGRSPRVHLTPERIPDLEVQIYFNAADIAVFPFQKILTSGSLILAMSFGKPVVAPRLNALEEVIPAEGVAWFDTQDEGLTLTDGMRQWLHLNLTKGAAANLECVREWSWEKIAVEILSTCRGSSVKA